MGLITEKRLEAARALASLKAKKPNKKDQEEAFSFVLTLCALNNYRKRMDNTRNWLSSNESDWIKGHYEYRMRHYRKRELEVSKNLLLKYGCSLLWTDSTPVLVTRTGANIDVPEMW